MRLEGDRGDRQSHPVVPGKEEPAFAIARIPRWWTAPFVTRRKKGATPPSVSLVLIASLLQQEWQPAFVKAGGKLFGPAATFFIGVWRCPRLSTLRRNPCARSWHGGCGGPVAVAHCWWWSVLVTALDCAAHKLAAHFGLGLALARDLAGQRRSRSSSAARRSLRCSCPRIDPGPLMRAGSGRIAGEYNLRYDKRTAVGKPIPMMLVTLSASYSGTSRRNVYARQVTAMTIATTLKNISTIS